MRCDTCTAARCCRHNMHPFASRADEFFNGRFSLEGVSVLSKRTVRLITHISLSVSISGAAGRKDNESMATHAQEQHTVLSSIKRGPE